MGPRIKRSLPKTRNSICGLARAPSLLAILADFKLCPAKLYSHLREFHDLNVHLSVYPSLVLFLR